MAPLPYVLEAAAGPLPSPDSLLSPFGRSRTISFWGFGPSWARLGGTSYRFAAYMGRFVIRKK